MKPLNVLTLLCFIIAVLFSWTALPDALAFDLARSFGDLKIVPGVRLGPWYLDRSISRQDVERTLGAGYGVGTVWPKDWDYPTQGLALVDRWNTNGLIMGFGKTNDRLCAVFAARHFSEGFNKYIEQFKFEPSGLTFKDRPLADYSRANGQPRFYTLDTDYPFVIFENRAAFVRWWVVGTFNEQACTGEGKIVRVPTLPLGPIQLARISTAREGDVAGATITRETSSFRPNQTVYLLIRFTFAELRNDIPGLAFVLTISAPGRPRNPIEVRRFFRAGTTSHSIVFVLEPSEPWPVGEVTLRVHAKDTEQLVGETKIVVE
jgi:hypothetical protein